jgi:hypothetical protein
MGRRLVDSLIAAVAGAFILLGGIGVAVYVQEDPSSVPDALWLVAFGVVLFVLSVKRW